MANFSWGLLLAHWLAFLDALQRFFSNYNLQPLLSTVFPRGRIEGAGSESELDSPIAQATPQTLLDPTDYIYTSTVDLCFIPTIFQTALVNVSCSVTDHTDYILNSDLDAAPTMGPSQDDAFLDTPVWQLAVTREDVPPAAQIEVSRSAHPRRL